MSESYKYLKLSKQNFTFINKYVIMNVWAFILFDLNALADTQIRI